MMINRNVKCCPCLCGSPVILSKVSRDVEGFYVLCAGKECWQGPVKPTEEEAIAAWTYVMVRLTSKAPKCPDCAGVLVKEKDTGEGVKRCEECKSSWYLLCCRKGKAG